MTHDTGGLPREIGPIVADEAIAAGACLVDVREPEEFAAGHAPLAASIPLGELDSRLDELAKDVTIVCVCRSGWRSQVAATVLSAAGFDAANLTGGMHAWLQEGLAVVAADGGPGSVI